MIPYIKGEVTQQAHVDVPDGLCEEEFARSGFFGRYAHLYRTEAPVKWTRIEGNLKPQLFDLRLAPVGSNFLEGQRFLLGNQDCRIYCSVFAKSMPYFVRNADGDEVFFVHAGQGRLETDFGPLTYEPGDYLVIPRGTVYRLLPEQKTFILGVESYSEITLPDKGMLGQHALFDPAMIRVPTPELNHAAKSRGTPNAGSQEFELRIKRNEEWTRVFYPFNPINTVGWKGTLTVWQLNVRDIRPISCDRYHLPPSAHTTFLGQNFVICTFLPRPLENGDPGAMKVPFYHSNIDFDEVLFYHAGEFFSRAGIDQGMLTFHPQGIHHGPQDAAVSRSKDVQRTNEIAVMIDTKRPLKVLESATSLEDPNYWQSWRS